MEKSVTIEFEGQTVSGSYEYDAKGKVLRVWNFHLGSKATQLGGSSQESLARMLLYELAREAKDKQQD